MNGRRQGAPRPDPPYAPAPGERDHTAPAVTPWPKSRDGPTWPLSAARQPAADQPWRPCQPGQLPAVGVQSRAKLQRRLWQNARALGWLQEACGLTPQAIDRFALGLTEPYYHKGALVTQDALAAPLLHCDGEFKRKYLHYCIPGITLDNRPSTQEAMKPRPWSPGGVWAYYSGGREAARNLFVCGEAKEVWILWQLLRQTPLATPLLLVAPTAGGSLPEEWLHGAYWDAWEHIYLGHGTDVPGAKPPAGSNDAYSAMLAEAAGRALLRVRPPIASARANNWTEWARAGGTAEQFAALLAHAAPLAAEGPHPIRTVGPAARAGSGHVAYTPVSIAGAYRDGYLYHTATLLLRSDEPAAAERQETLVIRSDRTVHRSGWARAPAGTRKDERVLRLTDGTLLAEAPKPNPYATWEWEGSPYSIDEYLHDRSRPRPLAAIVRDAIRHLRASAWLPHSEDYVLLGLTVPVTYAQAIFDAAPLLLAAGAKGTGKSRLARAMTELCANAPPPVHAMPATVIARLINQARGFVALDGFGKSGARPGDARFDELRHRLHLSVDRDSAQHGWTNSKTGRLERYDLFGVKMITSPQWVDDPSGARLIRIHARHRPEGMQVDAEPTLRGHELRALRNELHTWAFLSVARIASAYRRIAPGAPDRPGAGTAPLRVMAELAGDAALSEALHRALAAANPQPAPSPEQVLEEALRAIIRRSILQEGAVPAWVSLAQVELEVRRLVAENREQSPGGPISSTLESASWVSRVLRQRYADPATGPRRGSLYGKSLRAYRLADAFIDQTVQWLRTATPDTVIPARRSADFKAFCRTCAACPYSPHCDIRPRRRK